jgi:hypothetical protein
MGGSEIQVHRNKNKAERNKKKARRNKNQISFVRDFKYLRQKPVCGLVGLLPRDFGRCLPDMATVPPLSEKRKKMSILPQHAAALAKRDFGGLSPLSECDGGHSARRETAFTFH